jgi:hypothetical protein
MDSQPLTIDPNELPTLAQKALREDTPPPLKMMAAKGVLPGAKPADIVTVMVALQGSSDASVKAAATASLKQLPAPILDGALSSDLQLPVIGALAEYHGKNLAVAERLLRLPRMGGGPLLALAAGASEALGELVATNESLLLKNPEVIEALYMNKRVRMSTADRILELAVRNGLELDIPAFKQAAAAIVDELIPEPTEEESYDDVLFRETLAAGEDAQLRDDPEDDTHEKDEQGSEEVKREFLPLLMRLQQMTVTQKIRTAMLGTATERMILVRDSNRLVASAAASSPQMNENDAARIAASRAVSDDVLRIIAQNRNLTRSYQVKRNLIMNPKTPFTFTSRMIPHLRENDLRTMIKSRGIPASVQAAARQHMLRKKK